MANAVDWEFAERIAVRIATRGEVVDDYALARMADDFAEATPKAEKLVGETALARFLGGVIGLMVFLHVEHQIVHETLCIVRSSLSVNPFVNGLFFHREDLVKLSLDIVHDAAHIKAFEFLPPLILQLLQIGRAHV